MKFIVGLLIGSLGVLALTSFAVPDWEWPSRKPPPALVVDNAEAIATPEVAPVEIVSVEPAPAPAPPEPAVLAPSPPSSSSPPSKSDEEISQPLAASNDEAVTETAVVWKPFHSEVSAAGFARRLSVQLGYPFRALREGPAKYHVVFDYDTDEQRELLREQVQAVTGFSVL